MTDFTDLGDEIGRLIERDVSVDVNAFGKLLGVDSAKAAIVDLVARNVADAPEDTCTEALRAAITDLHAAVTALTDQSPDGAWTAADAMLDKVGAILDKRMTALDMAIKSLPGANDDVAVTRARAFEAYLTGN